MTNEPENMTEEKLKAIMAALPSELTASEISGLALWLYKSYGVSTADTLPELTNLVYVCGSMEGYSTADISKGLRAWADSVDAAESPH